MTERQLPRIGTMAPQGSTPVAVGLAVLGLASYGYLALAGRALDAVPYSALSVLWVLVFTVGPGVFLPIEQEIGRVVAARRSLGLSYGAVLVKAIAAIALALGLGLVALIVWAPFMDEHLFAGESAGRWCLAGAVVVLACASVARGVLAGRGLFGRYGIQLGVDGALRVISAGILLAAGARDLLPWGLVLTVCPLVALVSSLTRLPTDLSDRAPAAYEGLGMSHALLALLGATLASQVLANGSVVLAQLTRDPTQAAVVGSLLVSLVVARTPLFFYAALQASLLPRLSAARAAADERTFTVVLRRSIALVGGVALTNVAAVVLVGPWLVRTLFDVEPLSREVMTLLAVGTAIYLLAGVMSQGLLALERHGYSLAGWTVGLLMSGIVFLLLQRTALDLRLACAYVIGSAAAAAVILVLRRTTGQVPLMR
jgi:O-antigen/teichoic acid export membrane protein